MNMSMNICTHTEGSFTFCWPVQPKAVPTKCSIRHSWYWKGWIPGDGRMVGGMARGLKEGKCWEDRRVGWQEGGVGRAR